MSSRDQIITLMNRYAYTIDTGDLDGFAGLFEHAELLVEGSEPNVGKQDMLDNVASNIRIYADGTPRTKHLLSNIELTIDEEQDTAEAQSYYTVMQQTDDFPLQVIFSGHYFDRFERSEGEWRFVRRVIRYPLVGDLSAHLKSPSDIVPDA